MNMEIDSDILDPVVANDNFCRFVLNNKGFLHSFSAITFQLKAGDTNQYLPAGIGINSIIDRCALRVGQTTIAEISDFSSWSSYKSIFNDCDINLERETYLTGRGLCHEFNYQNGSQTKYSDVNASNYYLKTRREIDTSANASALYTGDGAGDELPLDCVSLANTPQFRIQMAQLFPFLATNQLPLYMIDQQVSVEIFFTPASSRKRTIMSSASATGAVLEIETSSLALIADYIYYDGEIMEQYRNANSVMSFNYVDYRLNKRTIQSANLNQKTVFDVGGAGRIVSKVICGLFDETMPNPEASVLNVYRASSPGLVNDNNKRFTTNLRYNDHYLYPLDRNNYAIHFADVIQAAGDVPHITRQEFSGEGVGGLSSGAGAITYNGQTLSDATVGLARNFFWNCYRLNKNERVNSRGIELEVQYGGTGGSGMTARDRTHKCWVELLRTATLNNGFFSQDFA
jgi:hypothetical protein